MTFVQAHFPFNKTFLLLLFYCHYVKEIPRPIFKEILKVLPYSDSVLFMGHPELAVAVSRSCCRCPGPLPSILMEDLCYPSFAVLELVLVMDVTSPYEFFHSICKILAWTLYGTEECWGNIAHL